MTEFLFYFFKSSFSHKCIIFSHLKMFTLYTELLPRVALKENFFIVQSAINALQLGKKIYINNKIDISILLFYKIRSYHNVK